MALAALAAELAGLVPGEPTSCLPAPGRSQLSSKGYGATIIYSASPTLKYRNDTTGGCERLARGDTLVTITPQTRVCRGDIATVLDRNSRFNVGSCSFGDFTRYERPREG